MAVSAGEVDATITVGVSRGACVGATKLHASEASSKTDTATMSFVFDMCQF